MLEKVKVSIICNTYNHEKYIEDTLTGFVSQCTDFPFEVLIHDDASTDNTQEIIKKYEKQYPNIIKPIYQTENQYSQKVKITNSIQLPRAQGEYIALCEGDDYWIDPNKLQKQFDILEEHKELDMCAHAAYIETNGLRKGVSKLSERVKIFSAEEVIIGDGDFFATASLFFRKSILESTLCAESPYHYDYLYQMLGSLRGGVVYLPGIMSVYRFQAAGSWTSKIKQNKTAIESNCDRIFTLLDYFNQGTNYRYTHVIEFQKAGYLFNKGKALSNKSLLREAKKTLCSWHYNDCYKLYIPSYRLRKFVKYHFDWVWKLGTKRKTKS